MQLPFFHKKNLSLLCKKESIAIQLSVLKKSVKDVTTIYKKHDLVISTYALAQRDEETLSNVSWRHLVLDEAQNIKNHAAKQTQAISILTGGGIRQLRIRQRIASSVSDRGKTCRHINTFALAHLKSA
jgi:hypothetical protein